MHSTRIRLTLHPDRDGAKNLRAEYGDRLVCVRYRYDAQNANGDISKQIRQKR
jgi:hypothetical protein